MRKLVGLLFATLAVYVIPFTKTFAQNTDVQSWTQVITQVNLNKEWFAYMEAQPRVGDDISRLERLLIRPAIGYNINPNIALFLGYAWTPTFMNSHYQEDFRNESRIWQQVLIKDSRWGLDWQHRLRQEQRFIQDAAGPSNRTRYLLRGSYALSDSGHYGLTGYNEIFVNLNSQFKGPQGGFDRDRFFFGPYVKYGPGRYEIGYLGERSQRFDEDGGRYINAMMMMAFLNF
ncbi:MAG: DUF2490 domain-containing protein [Proteobacteria bacterium]|nr:DUF2490 domain-containing protein [Pseudomonadota bacterium]